MSYVAIRNMGPALVTSDFSASTQRLPRRLGSWLLAISVLLLGVSGLYYLDKRDDDAVQSVRSDRTLPEMLVTSRRPHYDESKALLGTLAAYRQKRKPEDVSLITDYLNRYPDSPWRVSLLTNVGLIHYRAGYFSKAIVAWDQAWQAGKGSEQPEQRAIAEHAFGELIRMHARLGHAPEIERLLTDLGERKLAGGASEAVVGAREGLWVMKNNPGIAYLCGPMALKSLLQLGKPSSDMMSAINEIRSGDRGVSLAELQRYAFDLRMPYRMAFRLSKDVPIPVPSLVHWKLNHYAAIVEKSGDAYRVKDPTFGRDLWLSAAALNAESSGYFMVAPEQFISGWRDVAGNEAENVRGMGFTNSLDPDPTRPYDPKECKPGCSPGGAPEKGMASYAVHSMLVSLNIEDVPVGYTPPKGPAVNFHLTYNQREANQPANFNFSNVGPKWTHNWLSYVTDSPTQPGVDVSLAVPGGGTERYSGYNASTGIFTIESNQGAQLVRRNEASQLWYERRFADGSIHFYRTRDGAASFPRRIFLSEVRDPAGNAVSLTYDAQLRLTGLVDALNQTTVISYELAQHPLKITKVTDPFGRYASIAYDGAGRLESITDVLQMVSQFAYDGGSFVEKLTTPYGETTFAYSDLSGTARWLNVTDPLGYTERVETRHEAPGIPYSEALVPAGIGVFNYYINGRNTFYWDKDAWALRPGDYTAAKIKHWLHDRSRPTVTAPVLESSKMPLENRVWHNYPEQSVNGSAHYAFTGINDWPTKTARVLPDGSTQLSSAEYNAIGRLTKAVDPLGREVIYEYAANNIDLLRVLRKTASGYDVLASYGNYNAFRKPQAYTDAAGQTTTYQYNATGQLTKVTNPLAQERRYEYDANGYLMFIKNANNLVDQAFTYDAFGRVGSVTDLEGHRRVFAYDALDRVKRVTYPDSTYEEYTYDKLDVAKRRDRRGRETVYTHNAIRQLERVDEPLPRAIKYEWTRAGRLKKLTDGEDRTIEWKYDIQGRKSEEIYADGKRTTFGYDSAGRLSTVSDALNQLKTYTYARDDLLTGIGYSSSVHATAPVGFAYDPYYPRRTAMSDGLGNTAFAYKPVGTLGALKIAHEDGPYANDLIAYDYDALGRPTVQRVNGQAETVGYDELGRIWTRDNALGSYEFEYVGQSAQVHSRNAVAGPVILYEYEDNLRDRHLKRIRYFEEDDGSSIVAGRSAGASGVGPLINIQEYRYQRDTLGYLTQIDELPDGVESSARRWKLKVDSADRLLKMTPMGSEPAYAYTYDRADNRSQADYSGSSQVVSHNLLNQINTVDGQPYQHDFNGNVTSDGTNQYQWDAENRLIKVLSNTIAGKESVFAYDGLGRRLSIQDKPSASQPIVERRYAWCGHQPCQERDAQDNVLTIYYEEGELQQGTKVFYVRDQLGSVRMLRGMWRSPLGSYDYGPYGETQASSGPAASRFRYAGMFYHPATNLYLTWYRPYESRIGRWLSRDPMGIGDGPNLYAYVGGNPIDYSDPLGLWALKFGWYWGWGGSVTVGRDNGQTFWRAGAGVGVGGGFKYYPEGSFPKAPNAGCGCGARGFIGASGSFSASLGPASAEIKGEAGNVITQDCDGKPSWEYIERIDPNYSFRGKAGWGLSLGGGINFADLGVAR